MPAYLTHVATWKAIWPLLIAIPVLASLAFFCRTDRKEIFVVLMGFTALGIGTGYLTGTSRESAVGDVVPAALTLIGGLAVYLVGKEKSARYVVSLSMLVFAVSLLVGTRWGAVSRFEAELTLRSEDYLMRRADIEKRISDYRKALGLPVESSGMGDQSEKMPPTDGQRPHKATNRKPE